MLSGDNSILQKATDAKTQTGIGQEKEIVALAYNSALAKKISNGDTTDVTAGDLNTELTNQGANATGSSPIKVTFTVSKRQYTIDSNRIIDFVGIKSDDENNSDDFSYDNPYIPTNFSHTVGTWNTGFTIIGDEGTDNEGDEFVWVPCVLDQTKVKSGDIVQTFERHFSSLTDETDPHYEDREHQVYQGSDFALSVNDEGNSATSIRTSVATYGGFYIAKYEASQDNEKAKSIANASVWNNILRSNAITVAEGMIATNTGCNSALISGECWDTTLQWIKQTTNSNYDLNSTGKGYYEMDYDDGPTSTGTNGDYSVNNIYDMAGNVAEWTTENYTGDGASEPLYRGGCYYNSSWSVAQRSNDYDGDVESDGIGFRVVLYK